MATHVLVFAMLMHTELFVHMSLNVIAEFVWINKQIALCVAFCRYNSRNRRQMAASLISWLSCQSRIHWMMAAARTGLLIRWTTHQARRRRVHVQGEEGKVDGLTQPRQWTRVELVSLCVVGVERHTVRPVRDAIGLVASQVANRIHLTATRTTLIQPSVGRTRNVEMAWRERRLHRNRP